MGRKRRVHNIEGNQQTWWVIGYEHEGKLVTAQDSQSATNSLDSPKVYHLCSPLSIGGVRDDGRCTFYAD
jgi:hypothetical protein